MFGGLGGLGGLNPKKMQEMMKKLGMDQQEISALRVVIEKADGKKMVIENPTISKISVQGQDSFQISGDVSETGEEDSEETSESDIKTITEKTGCKESEARKALEESNWDLAEAILKLS